MDPKTKDPPGPLTESALHRPARGGSPRKDVISEGSENSVLDWFQPARKNQFHKPSARETAGAKTWPTKDAGSHELIGSAFIDAGGGFGSARCRPNRPSQVPKSKGHTFRFRFVSASKFYGPLSWSLSWQCTVNQTPTAEPPGAEISRGHGDASEASGNN